MQFLVCCRHLHLCQCYPYHVDQVGLLFVPLFPFIVQLGQLQQFPYQTVHPIRFLIDNFEEMANGTTVVNFSVYQRLGITLDRSKGRFQFMRNVGYEIPLHILKLLLLGNVQQNYNHTGILTVLVHKPVIANIVNPSTLFDNLVEASIQAILTNALKKQIPAKGPNNFIIGFFFDFLLLHS